MNLNKLSEQLTVTGQIEPRDVSDLAKQGFRSIICNRPDGEAADQPNHIDIERAASDRGMAFIYLPVVASNITEADVAAFKRALKELPAPILAYCRTGGRSAKLWELSRLLGETA